MVSSLPFVSLFLIRLCTTFRFCSAQGRNEGGGGKGAQSLRVESLWGPTNDYGQRRIVPTMSQVISSIQCICFRKTSGSTWGRQTWFLPRAPSNLVTPLALLHVYILILKYEFDRHSDLNQLPSDELTNKTCPWFWAMGHCLLILI